MSNSKLLFPSEASDWDMQTANSNPVFGSDTNQQSQPQNKLGMKANCVCNDCKPMKQQQDMPSNSTDNLWNDLPCSTPLRAPMKNPFEVYINGARAHVAGCILPERHNGFCVGTDAPFYFELNPPPEKLPEPVPACKWHDKVVGAFANFSYVEGGDPYEQGAQQHRVNNLARAELEQKARKAIQRNLAAWPTCDQGTVTVRWWHATDELYVARWECACGGLG